MKAEEEEEEGEEGSDEAGSEEQSGNEETSTSEDVLVGASKKGKGKGAAPKTSTALIKTVAAKVNNAVKPAVKKPKKAEAEEEKAPPKKAATKTENLEAGKEADTTESTNASSKATEAKEVEEDRKLKANDAGDTEVKRRKVDIPKPRRLVTSPPNDVEIVDITHVEELRKEVERQKTSLAMQCRQLEQSEWKHIDTAIHAAKLNSTIAKSQTQFMDLYQNV